MAPLTPVWTKEEVLKKLKNSRSGLNLETLFDVEPSSFLASFFNNDEIKGSAKNIEGVRTDPECIIKALIQNECNFDRITGEYVCIPFKRLFKECKVYNPRKPKLNKPSSNNNNNNNDKAKTAEPEYRIQRVEITGMNTNDDFYLERSQPGNSNEQSDLIKDLKKYHSLKRP